MSLEYNTTHTSMFASRDFFITILVTIVSLPALAASPIADGDYTNVAVTFSTLDVGVNAANCVVQCR
jgi:hypothetical protein